MGVFFKHTRGAVKVVDGPWQGAPQLRIKLPGVEDHFNNSRAILTQVGVQQQGNFQFVHTMGDQVFVYVFGDRISEFSVSGVAFTNLCDNQGGADQNTGLEGVLKGYQENRLAKTGRPVIAAVGGFNFQAFLTGFSLEIVDPELQLAQFSYRFHGFPEEL